MVFWVIVELFSSTFTRDINSDGFLKEEKYKEKNY